MLHSKEKKVQRAWIMFIFLINLIATKQSLSYGVVLTKRLLRQQDHLLKIKFPHVPRNDAAVVRFALAGIAIGGVLLIRSNLPCNRHCEKLREFSFFD